MKRTSSSAQPPLSSRRQADSLTPWHAGELHSVVHEALPLERAGPGHQLSLMVTACRWRRGGVRGDTLGRSAPTGAGRDTLPRLRTHRAKAIL